MVRELRILAAAILLSFSAAQAAQVPISVYPNPIQFPTTALNTTSYPQTVFVNNSSTKTVQVTGITISGGNSSDFAFYGATCVGPLAGGQSCEMAMTFTPTVTGNRSSSLVVTFSGTGSPLSIPLLGYGGNPYPTITALSPPNVYVGSPSLLLTINGSSFIPSSYVSVNNVQLATTFVSSTQVTTQVAASYLTQIGSEYISVTNPAPGGGTASADLEVVALDPTVSQVAPIALVAGSGANSITVEGGNFMTGATVLWNGKSLATTYVSSSQLQAQLTASEVSKPQIALLSVSNPSPGGISTTIDFDVTYSATIRILDLPANDLVWDPYAQKIYASLPSSYGSNGNTIAVINPTKGTVDGYFYAGSEPNRLALSADASYLYAGLNGSGSVQRLSLPGFTPDIDVSLGTSQYGGVYTAGDLKVSPADPHTFAVTLGTSGCCGGGPLEFFKDSNQLPNSISNPEIAYLQFANASTLYGYDSGILSEIAVSGNGGTLTTQFNSLLTGYGEIEYDAGLVYGNAGQVLNPATGDLVGTYDVGDNNGSISVLPESAINSTFVLGITPFFSSFGITSYDLSHFTPSAVINLSQLNGGGYGVTSSNFINWGRNGLAFVVESGCCGSQNYQTVLIQSNMMQPVSTKKNPVPVTVSLAPASAIHGAGNFQLTVNGSNFVPGSQVTWNGSQRSVSYVSATQLIVYIPWSDIVSAGTATVLVTNPTPGGGKSTSLTFTIN
jgi:hypothetical protein